MQIIPVIDLLNGVVVHAKRGERQQYQPIQSKLCDSHAPLAIVSALLDNMPFTQLYIADLNAIQKLEAQYTTNYSAIAAIAKKYPQITLWVDAGISNNTELQYWQKLKVRLVIASENFKTIAQYHSLNLAETPHILSLDFFPKGYVGPLELLANCQHWPQDVIVMSLANVGANAGVNTELLMEIKARAQQHSLIAAGGIRNIDDLKALKALGIQQALMATALHQQQITAALLAKL